MVFSFFVVGRICWHWIKVLPASVRMMLPAFLVKMLPSLPENMMAVGSLIDTFLPSSILYTDLIGAIFCKRPVRRLEVLPLNGEFRG